MTMHRTLKLQIGVCDSFAVKFKQLCAFKLVTNEKVNPSHPVLQVSIDFWNT